MVSRSYKAARSSESAKSAESLETSAAKLAPLDDTRISEREHRPRSLRGGEEPGEGKETRIPAELVPRWRRAAQRAAKADFIPGHVQACANNPHRSARWTLAIWNRAKPLEQTRIAYTCGSYRCASPECQRAAAHRDFAKVSEAVSSVTSSPESWCLVVLTIDQHSTLSKRANGEGWKDEQEAFRALSRMTRNFLARMRRWHAREGWEDFGNRWVATVEVQNNGWPHLNLMIHSPGLASWLDSVPERTIRTKDGTRTAMGKPLTHELRDHAVACDWGPVGYASRAHSRDALVGYITKLAGNLDATSGEIAKLTQTPTNARMKLRRIRAGKGFIRTTEKNENYTGIMLRRKRELDGSEYVQPLMEPDQVRCAPEDQPAYLEGVREAIRAEQEQADREREGERERLRVEHEREHALIALVREQTTEREREEWAARVERAKKRRKRSGL